MNDQDPTNLPIFGARSAELQGSGENAPVRNTAQTGPRARSLAGRIDAHPAPTRPVSVVPPAPSNDHTVMPWPGKVTGTYVSPPESANVPVNGRSQGQAAEDLPAIDWRQVGEYRAEASRRLAENLGSDKDKDPEAERELGKDIIQTILDDAAAEKLHDGETAPGPLEQRAMARAIFDALFGLGRLQPLVDDDSVENIIITGADNVWVEKITGELVRMGPVAESDQQLLQDLAFIASRSEASSRSFTSANPRLHMRLDTGDRLAAAAWVTARPAVVIRRHRLRRVTLDDLVGLKMLSPVQASLLRAAVRAKKSIVVAGPQGAGKTTMVRALCAEIPRYEAIGTFETEFELHLHELTDVHDIVHAWEARPGSGEVGPDGRQAGEFTLTEALYDSFRFALTRQIVGEVRGNEVWAMIKAMESGAGSISTTHSATGEGTIRKLVTCAMEAGPHVTRELATSKLAETIDLVVQIGLETQPQDETGTSWRRSRWVSEIVHVAPGEVVKGYATTHIFRNNPRGGPGVPGTIPDELRDDLVRYGFDDNAYQAQSVHEESVR